MYLRIFIIIVDMRTKEVSKCTEVLNEAFLVKIANSNVMPTCTLRGFRWYPYFGAQE